MPVASATKMARPGGGKAGVSDRNVNGRNVSGIDRPPATPFGRKMATTFNWLQNEGVPMAKAIAKLRSIYDEACAAGSQGQEDFFLYTSFFVQMPLSSGSVKERMGKGDEKVLETVCKFAVSFLQVNYLPKRLTKAIIFHGKISPR